MTGSPTLEPSIRTGGASTDSQSARAEGCIVGGVVDVGEVVVAAWVVVGAWVVVDATVVDGTVVGAAVVVGADVASTASVVAESSDPHAEMMASDETVRSAVSR